MELKYRILIGLISLILGGVISYLIFTDQYSSQPKLNYNSKDHNELNSAGNSVILYFIISILIIFLFLFLWQPIVNYILKNFKYANEVISSGLTFAILIPVVGKSIYGTYNLCYRKFAQYLDALNDKETKWIMVVACIGLILIFLICHEYELAFTALALIVGKFMWLDTTSEQLFLEIKETMHLPVFILITLSLCLFLGIFTFLDEKFSVLYGLLLGLGFLLGIILYGLIHDKNKSKDN